jgi:hypothetical protein
MGLLNLLEQNKNLKQIIIPDFLKVTEKSKNTKKSLLSALNGYLDEGIFSINLANKELIDAKGRVGGVITSTTKASFFQNSKNWNAIGFKSRFIVVSWEYSDDTKMEILRKIAKEENTHNIKPTTIKQKLTKIETNFKLSNKLINISDKSTRKLKNFKVLLKSIALNNNHKKPTESDFKELKELSKLINVKFTRI